MSRWVVVAVLLMAGCRGCDVPAGAVLDCGPRRADLAAGAEPSRCSMEGHCVARDGDCVAGGDEDCQQSMVCDEAGFCTALDGRCWRAGASDGECTTPPRPGYAETCATYGHCTAVDGVCQATSDAQCEASLWCARGGDCSVRRGRCVAADEGRCRESDYCDWFALCSLVEDVCRARSDADCRVHSDKCATSGQCVLTEDGCAPTRPAHCESSQNCDDYGWCSLEAGRCVGATRTKTP